MLEQGQVIIVGCNRTCRFIPWTSMAPQPLYNIKKLQPYSGRACARIPRAALLAQPQKHAFPPATNGGGAERRGQSHALGHGPLENAHITVLNCLLQKPRRIHHAGPLLVQKVQRGDIAPCGIRWE